MYWQNMSTIASEIACFNDVFIKHNFDNHEERCRYGQLWKSFPLERYQR